jgi:hypothetical protein
MTSTTAPKYLSIVPDPRPWRERNLEVVQLGLAWLRRLLEAHILQLRTAAPPQAFEHGSQEVMSDLKADWLLRELGSSRVPAHEKLETVEPARRAYEAVCTAMREAGEPAAIDRLSALFGLAPFDEDVLLLALAPRLEAGFQALYGYAHDRLALGRATPHLALAMLARTADAASEARDRLRPSAPLRRFALIRMDEGGTDALAPLQMDERIAGYLLGEDEVDPQVHLCLRPLTIGPCPDRHRQTVDALATRVRQSARPGAMIIGPPRCGRRAAAARLAGHFGLGLVELDPRALPADPEARRARFALVAREAVLSGLALAIDLQPSSVPDSDDGARLARTAAQEALTGLDALLILLAEEPITLTIPVPSVRLAALTAADRGALWRSLLDTTTDGTGEAVDAVAEQFALGPAEISFVAEQSGTDLPALWSACREVAGRGLDALAERIEPRFGWDDIVLPAAVHEDLEALVAQVRHRSEVYGRWGFERRLPRGRGVSVLFAGPSGVGKTMAAEVIARDLDLDLYRIDLSGVVSKYIGETEKNLRRVFDAAEGAGAILFFDEADALFGKRTEVKDSHDRYANIEVSYLLQRMEAYSGLAILATNLKGHLDQAFLRRLRYVIDFPFPDAALRYAIWERAFPPEAPTNGLDLDALARLEIAGGNITVIAVNAAFLAVTEGLPIGMVHVARAARAELRKLDKEFRPFWPEG